MSKAKRFISGAVCPQCREVDRTVIEGIAAASSEISLDELPTEHIQRRCVACGFIEALESGQNAVNAAIPRARHERSRVATTRATPVQIIDPSGPKPS